MLAQAGDVAGDGVSGHFSSFVYGAAVSDAARESRNQRGIAALRFGAEHDVVPVTSFGHETAIILAGTGSRSRKSAATIINSTQESASLLTRYSQCATR